MLFTQQSEKRKVMGKVKMKIFVLLTVVLIGCGPRSFPPFSDWPPNATGKAR